MLPTSPHPYLDYLDQIVRVFGMPSIVGAVVWGVQKYEKSNKAFQQLSLNSQTTVDEVAKVKAQVTLLQTNHMAHLQIDMTRVAVSSEKQVEVLNDIRKDLAVVLDRVPRVSQQS